MRVLSRVVEIEVRPRRSRDTKSNRPRAESRAQSRMFGLEAEGYVAVGRTVWTLAVRARHERRREAAEAREAARWPTAAADHCYGCGKSWSHDLECTCAATAAAAIAMAIGNRDAAP